jgi:hypothetical protein
MTARHRLATVARILAPDELAVLVLIAQRLALGRRRYGALDVVHDRRDFWREALEELADAAVYLAADLVRRRRRRAAARRPARRGRRG